MAQVFQTHYNSNYKKYAYSKRDLIVPKDEFSSLPPDGGNWLNPQTEKKKDHKESLEIIEDAVRKRVIMNYTTTYSSQFYHRKAYSDLPQSETTNELIKHCERVFRDKPKSKKVYPPLTTSRRIYGYLRPTGIYAPLSTYQDIYESVGFQILRDGFPRGLAEDDAQSELKQLCDDEKDVICESNKGTMTMWGQDCIVYKKCDGK